MWKQSSKSSLKKEEVYFKTRNDSKDIKIKKSLNHNLFDYKLVDKL